jgi:nucleotide-binding universal stress UspA family protein
MGFKRILVPTDLTNRTAKALDLAIALARADGSRVTLLHVVETVRGLEFDELRPFYRQLERRGREKMAALARRAGDSGGRIIQTVVYGARAEEIVKFATAHKVDLIVLASHRVKPYMVGRDWGTISYKVGILAQCPVLLVK